MWKISYWYDKFFWADMKWLIFFPVLSFKKWPFWPFLGTFWYWNFVAQRMYWQTTNLTSPVNMKKYRYSCFICHLSFLWSVQRGNKQVQLLKVDIVWYRYYRYFSTSCIAITLIGFYHISNVSTQWFKSGEISPAKKGLMYLKLPRGRRLDEPEAMKKILFLISKYEMPSK